MKSIGKLGGQNNLRLSNNRDIAEGLGAFVQQ